MKKNDTPISYEVNRKIRRDWGEIKPITKIIPNKKKNPKIKHKGKAWDDQSHFGPETFLT